MFLSETADKRIDAKARQALIELAPRLNCRGAGMAFDSLLRHAFHSEHADDHNSRSLRYC
jgi:hypothetical protein